MVIKREVILYKIESIYRTDAAPSAALDAVLVEEPSWANESLRMNERPSVKASLGALQRIFGGRLEAVTFSVEVKGSGAAGTPPELAPFLRTAGFGEAIVVSTSVTYAPVSTGLESGTLYYYQDGTLRKLLGCITTALSYAGAAGEVAKFNVTVVGHPETVTDATLVAPTYDTNKPVAVKGAGFSIGGYAASIAAVNFDIGIQPAFPPDVSKANGFGRLQIVDTDLNGSFDPEHTLVAAKDWMGEFEAGTTMVLDSGVIGSVTGNRFQITMPAAYYMDISPANRDGIRTLEVPFGAAEATTDDAISIVFT